MIVWGISTSPCSKPWTLNFFSTFRRKFKRSVEKKVKKKKKIHSQSHRPNFFFLFLVMKPQTMIFFFFWPYRFRAMHAGTSYDPDKSGQLEPTPPEEEYEPPPPQQHTVPPPPALPFKGYIPMSTKYIIFGLFLIVLGLDFILYSTGNLKFNF